MRYCPSAPSLAVRCRLQVAGPVPVPHVVTAGIGVPIRHAWACSSTVSAGRVAGAAADNVMVLAPVTKVVKDRTTLGALAVAAATVGGAGYGSSSMWYVTLMHGPFGDRKSTRLNSS